MLRNLAHVGGNDPRRERSFSTGVPRPTALRRENASFRSENSFFGADMVHSSRLVRVVRSGSASAAKLRAGALLRRRGSCSAVSKQIFASNMGFATFFQAP